MQVRAAEMNLPLKDLQAAPRREIPMLRAFWRLVYAHGDKGADISISNASKWAALSSQANHWLGHFALGFLARFRADGLEEADVGRYYLKSFRDRDGRMIKAAASGDPIASYALAEIFTSDEVRPSLEPDLELAAEHYSIASRAGYGPASVEFALSRLMWLETTNLESRKTCLEESLSCRKRPRRTCLRQIIIWEGFYQGIRSHRRPQDGSCSLSGSRRQGHAISQLTVADFHAYGEAGSQSKSTLLSVTPVWPWIKWKLRPCRRYQTTKSFLQEVNRSVG